MPRGLVVPDPEQITRLRSEAGLTQCGLAEDSGYALRTISKIEAGRPTNAATLTAVAGALSRKLRRGVALGDLMLNRPDAPAESVFGRAGPTVVEHVKVLDLRPWRPASEPGPCGVVLHDLLRFRTLPREFRELICHYATAGTQVRGRCVSHPEGSKWLEVTDFGTAATQDNHLGHCFALHARLGDSCGGTDLLNEVVYEDGFQDPVREWFHSHVVLPTESLTFVLLFPDHKPCLSIRGICKRHPAEAFQAPMEQPVGVCPGILIHWRVASPLVGGLYQLEWQW